MSSGYYNAAAAAAVEQLGFDPYMTTYPHVYLARVGETCPPAPARRWREGRTPEGRAVYARRKVIVEPVFGQIKEGRGFCRFLLRGLDRIGGEWRLVCVTHNLLKIGATRVRLYRVTPNIWRHMYHQYLPLKASYHL